MRSVVIPALLLSALAGLAAVPSASAAPPAPACNGIVHLDEEVGPVHASITPGQCYEFTVDAFSCPLGPKEETRHDVVAGGSRITLIVLTCSTPGAESTSAAAPPCTCPPPPRCNAATSTGLLDQVVSIDITSDCRVVIDVLPIVACAMEPLDGRRTITQGRVSVTLPCGQVDSCEPPLECYPTTSSALLIPPVCIERDIDQGAIEGHVGQCGPQYVGLVDCSGGGAQRIHFDSRDHTGRLPLGDRVYVLVDYCLPHSPPPSLGMAAMADPFPTCIRECSPVPNPGCDLQSATPSDLPATTIDAQRLLWGGDCDVDFETACLGGSSDSTDVRAAFVSVSLARCDGGIDAIGWS